MKYAEYEKLTLLLEQENKTVNDLLEEVTGAMAPMNEAEPKELDTTGGKRSIGEIKNPFLRGKLTKAAKRMQKMINDQIVEKHYNAIIQDSQDVINKIIKLGSQNKTPEEIVKYLEKNIAIVDKTISSRYKNLEAAISKLIDNSTTKVNSLLAKKNLSDTVKMNLENYWTLLSTQVFQNAYSSIAEKQTNYVKENIGEGQQDLVENILKISTLEGAAAKKEKEAATLKDEVKKADATGGEDKKETTDPKAEHKYEIVPVSKPENEPVEVTVDNTEGDVITITKPDGDKKKVKKEDYKWTFTPKAQELIAGKEPKALGEPEPENKKAKPMGAGPEDTSGKKPIPMGSGKKKTTSKPKPKLQPEKGKRPLAKTGVKKNPKGKLNASVEEPEGRKMVSENLSDFLK